MTVIESSSPGPIMAASRQTLVTSAPDELLRQEKVKVISGSYGQSMGNHMPLISESMVRMIIIHHSTKDIVGFKVLGLALAYIYIVDSYARTSNSGRA